MSDIKLGLVQDFNSALTGGGTFAHTDSNFGGASPKGVLHSIVYATALNTRANHFSLAIGGVMSATQGELFTMHSVSQHGAANDDTFRDARDELAGYLGNPQNVNNSRDGHHDFSSFSNNTITYTVGNTYNNDYGLMSLLLGGADLDVDIGTFTLDSQAVDTEAFVVTGFDMSNSVLIIFSVLTDWNADTATTSDDGMRAIWGMGSYDGTTFRQACMSLAQRDGSSTSEPVCYLDDSRIVLKCDDTTGAVEYSLQWTSVDATSGGRFGLTPRTAGTPAAGNDFGYIALGLPSDWNATVTVEDTPTSAGNQAYNPTGGTGWTPQLLIQILSLMEAVDTAATDDTAGGIGMRVVIGTGADDEYCVSGNIEDASANTDTEVGIHDSGFLNEDDGTGGYEMDLVSFDSGGWTDNFASVHTNAKKTICLTMGEDDPAGEGVITRRRGGKTLRRM